MIDFNTVLNTLLDQIIEQASMPLIKRIVDLEEQVKKSMAIDLESYAFHDAVKTIVEEKIDIHERSWDHDDFLTEIDASDVRDAVREMEFEVRVL